MDKVLIVEDDAAISDLIKLNLDMAGYDSRQAFDGGCCTRHPRDVFSEFGFIGYFSPRHARL